MQTFFSLNSSLEFVVDIAVLLFPDSQQCSICLQLPLQTCLRLVKSSINRIAFSVVSGGGFRLSE